MLPYQAVAMDYAVTSTFQRQSPINPAFTHSCILELRKEKSRDAARSRRGKENYEFYELAKMLPLPAAITSQLDKASIIRLTISYLRLRDFSAHGDPPWSREGPPPNKNVKGDCGSSMVDVYKLLLDYKSKYWKGGPVRPRSVAGIAMEIFEQHQGTHILQSLDGFAFALAADGRFLYISETVSIYLGLSQVEMTGSSVFDYIHHQDHAELAEHLGLGLAQGQSLASPSSAASEEGVNSSTGTANPDVATLMTINSNSPYKGIDRAFCIRMKSTLTKRGCHFKSSGYRVVLVLCRLRPQYTFSHSRKSPPPLLGMVALAIALPPPSVHEIRLESDMFVTRITFDFRIAHCEPRVSELLDYTADELTGKNMYSLCHGEDANKLRKCHVDLINKGQVMSQYYRLMNKSGGYTWMQTCATVVCNTKNADEQTIICVNYVISGREFENLVMDCCQMEDKMQIVKREETGGNDPENGSPDADRGEGRSSGGPPNQDPHRSPPDIEDGSSEHGEQGRGHLDHVTQLQGSAHLPGEATQMAPVLNVRALKEDASKEVIVEARRRAQKRKLEEGLPREDTSSSSEEDVVCVKRSVLSPDSVSLSSSSVQAPVTSSNAVNSVTAEPSPKADDTDQSNDSAQWKKTFNGAYDCSASGDHGTSVKDLEHAMSKHLPVLKDASDQPTDFSADALLKQQRSTIQWIGAQQPSAPLPASALLRQLYANRESVIRANVHASRPTYYSDMQGTLPTPPSSEGYNDQAAQFVLPQKAGTHDGFTSIVSYSAAPTYTDYHSAMTPPSSVSPRDKVHSFAESPVYSAESAAAAALRHQYLGDSPAQPLPLKPQVYAVHPGTTVPGLDAQYAASTLADQSQFYAHHSTGFHLYHPTANKASSYPDALKNGTNWYSTAS